MFKNVTNYSLRKILEGAARRGYFLLLVITIMVCVSFSIVTQNERATETQVLALSEKIGVLQSQLDNLQVEDTSVVETAVESTPVVISEPETVSQHTAEQIVVTGKLKNYTKPEPAATPTALPEDENCVPMGEVTSLRYVFMEEYPIPVRSLVEFVPVCDSTSLAVKWVESLGAGIVEHYFSFQGADLDFQYFTDPGSSSSTSWRAPRSGESGLITYYEDWYDVAGEWEPDGIVDGVNVLELREWKEDEVALIGYGNAFYNEAVSGGWFYFSYATDCGASEYLMNGRPITPGPYGFTYKAPAEGGTFSAFYEAGTCWYNTDTVRWSVEVHPGDAVVGTEDIAVFSMKDSDPWAFCYRMEWMRPVWSPEYLPYRDEGVCPYLYGMNNTGTLATLARQGYMRADTRYGDNHPAGWVPFVYWGNDLKNIVTSWPEHEWVRVDSIDLGNGDVYSVTVDTKESAPIFSFVEGGPEPSAYTSDIPWYGGWGTPILFVAEDHVDDSYYVDWPKMKIYRIRYYTASQAVIEMVVWKTTESQ